MCVSMDLVDILIIQINMFVSPHHHATFHRYIQVCRAPGTVYTGVYRCIRLYTGTYRYIYIIQGQTHIIPKIPGTDTAVITKVYVN